MSRIIILGTAMTSVAGMPEDDWEVWGCGTAWQLTDRADRWFELHNIDALRQTPQLYGPHLAWLDSQTIPIMVKAKYAGIKNPVVYPIDKVKAEFGDYFTTTIAYMIAYAMLREELGEEPVTDMAIMGVNMAWNEEYSEQRPSCEHMIGWAQGKGIKVSISDVSDLLRCGHLYAFQQPPNVQRRLESKLSSLKRDIKIRAHEKQIAGDDELLLKGELKAMEYTLRHL